MKNRPKHPRDQSSSRGERARRQHQEAALDDALKNTFPASDPVSIEQPAPPAADYGRGQAGSEAAARRQKRYKPAFNLFLSGSPEQRVQHARLVEVLEQLPFNSRDEGKVILTRQLYSMQVQPRERRHQHR